MGAGPDRGHSGGGRQQVPLTPEPPRVLEWGVRRGTRAIQGGVAPEQPYVPEGGGAQERRGMCAQEERRACMQRGMWGWRAWEWEREWMALGVPMWERRTGKWGHTGKGGCALEALWEGQVGRCQGHLPMGTLHKLVHLPPWTVHQAWRAYLITHP